MADPRLTTINPLPNKTSAGEMLSDLFRMKNNRASSFSGKGNVGKEDFDVLLDQVEMHSTKVKTETENYWLFLKDIPIAVMLIFCNKKAESNGPGSDYLYSLGINRLWAAGLLPVTKQGKTRLLGDFRSEEHLQIVENIRCVKEWGFIEKEELVNCYIQFSYYLARFTFGMFHVAFDPDRARVERKTVRYELFMDFVQLLSERDSLIAKLLYFGAPSIETVISLKMAALDVEKMEIKFESGSIRFPKHLIKDIEVYTQSKKIGSNSLIFVNVRGKEVERVHLNQAFLRASLKMPEVFKITPAVLLKVV